MTFGPAVNAHVETKCKNYKYIKPIVGIQSGYYYEWRQWRLTIT